MKISLQLLMPLHVKNLIHLIACLTHILASRLPAESPMPKPGKVKGYTKKSSRCGNRLASHSLSY